MKQFIYTFLLFSIITNYIASQEISDWRGPGRTGVYDEAGLLKHWPENGPELLWFIDSILPSGYSSVSIANQTIYLTGNDNMQDVLIAIDMNGKIKWQTVYGKSWENSYSESRSTPTIEGDRVYVSSGTGEVVCLNGNNGEIIWKIDAMKKFSGKFHRWGIAESILLYENKVFFTCGGNKTTMVALDKMTGETIWQSISLNDKPSYASPLLIERTGKKQIINVTTTYVIGVNPENGKIIWKFNFGEYLNENGYNNQTNTPLYFDGKIYVTSGYNHKSVMLDLSADGKSVSLAWVDTVLDVHHGGVVKVGNYIYGANWEHNRMGKWICLDWNTGEVKYEEEWINKGSIISAENMLYCYEEKTGNIALVNAIPDEFKVISSFQVPFGNGPYWSHPVIHNGVLYLRHGDALMAYYIKEKKSN